LVYAGGVLHLPVYAAPRPTAAMHVTPTALSFALGATQPITFAGRDLQGGIAPTDVVALASVLELKLRSPNTRPAWLDANAPDRFDHADLQYVGVTSDAAFGGAARGDEARLYVGITTWGDWSTPAEIGVSVLLDTNGDGEHDFRVTNGTPPVPAFGAGPVGPLVSQIYDLGTGQLVAQQPLNSVDPTLFDTNLFFTNALVLPVRLADVGIGPNGGTISFVVQTTSADTLKSEGKFIDRTPVLRFDPLRPALSFSPAPVEGPVYRDRHGGQLDVRVNGDVFPFQPPAGVLVIHHHNGSPGTTDSRADAIAIDYRWPWTMYLPVVKQLAAP
jgi:hypothetical protein